VEREFQRLEAERVGEDPDQENKIADMAIKMEELEAKLDSSNSRLESKIDASQSRIEAIFQQLLAGRGNVTSVVPIVSPTGPDPILHILQRTEMPRNTAPEEEVGTGELTVQIGEGNSHLAAEEGCVEKGPEQTEEQTEEQIEVPEQLQGSEQPEAAEQPEGPEQPEVLEQVAVSKKDTESSKEKTPKVVKAAGLSKPTKVDALKTPSPAGSASLPKPGNRIGSSTRSEVAKKKSTR